MDKIIRILFIILGIIFFPFSFLFLDWLEQKENEKIKLYQDEIKNEPVYLYFDNYDPRNPHEIFKSNPPLQFLDEYQKS